MDELLQALEQLYNEQDNSYYDEDTRRSYFNESELYSKVVGLCDEYLIPSYGLDDYENKRILKENGYTVFAIEQDSFGWLIGGVKKQNDNRIVVYG